MVSFAGKGPFSVTSIDSMVTSIDSWTYLDALGGISATGSYAFDSYVDLVTVATRRFEADIAATRADLAAAQEVLLSQSQEGQELADRLAASEQRQEEERREGAGAVGLRLKETCARYRRIPFLPQQPTINSSFSFSCPFELHNKNNKTNSKNTSKKKGRRKGGNRTSHNCFIYQCKTQAGVTRAAMMVGRELLEERGSAADRGKEEEGKKREGEEEAAEAGYLDEAARAAERKVLLAAQGKLSEEAEAGEKKEDGAKVDVDRKSVV